MNIQLVDKVCHFPNYKVYSRQDVQYPYHLYYSQARVRSCSNAFKIAVIFWKDWNYIRYMKTICATTFGTCKLHALHSVHTKYMRYIRCLQTTCATLGVCKLHALHSVHSKYMGYIRCLQTTCATLGVCKLHALHSVHVNYMRYIR